MEEDVNIWQYLFVVQAVLCCQKIFVLFTSKTIIPLMILFFL